MANTDRPFGFRLWGALQPPTPYDRDATSSTPIYPGDLVTLDNDGNINAAAAGERLLGVARDFATGSLAKTNIMVWDNPNQKFVAQDDGTGATSAQTTIGLNADHVAGSGSLITKLSAHEIDISSATTVAAGLRLLGFVNRPDNEVTTFTEWYCRIAEHKFSTEVGL